MSCCNGFSPAGTQALPFSSWSFTRRPRLWQMVPTNLLSLVCLFRSDAELLTQIKSAVWLISLLCNRLLASCKTEFKCLAVSYARAGYFSYTTKFDHFLAEELRKRERRHRTVYKSLEFVDYLITKLYSFKSFISIM